LLYSFKLLAICSVSLVTACTSASASRKADHDPSIQQEAAQEIGRVCALPDADRDAEKHRIKDQSGFVVVCAK
jgi:hypothetical protein